MRENNEKEVNFHDFCPKCAFCDTSETAEPCDSCLEIGAKEGSVVPENYVEKGENSKNE